MEKRTIDITPTPQGCQRMKLLFEQSVQEYQHQLGLLDLIEHYGIEVEAYEHEKSRGIAALFHEIIDVRRATIEESIASLQEGIAELTQQGY